jgi:cystathionine beta-synthase
MTRMGIVDSLVDVVGATPLVRLNRFGADVPPTLLGKVEYLNPGGSVKDRIALGMVTAAEEQGLLRPGGTIVEPTSGNTGVGLAIVAAQRGYRCIFVVPDKVSTEKIDTLRAYGAEVVVCPTAVDPQDPRSYYRVSDRLAKEVPGAAKLDQYANPANPAAHYATTGPEIWEQTGGRIDVFVAGVGTGGTISGAGRYLKERNPDLVVVGADPEGSLYSGDRAHPYLVEGVGEDFIPATFDPQVVDRWVTVGDGDAFRTTRRLAREEGLLVGGSCGLAGWAALQVAGEYPADATVVVLLPDTGRFYLGKVFNDDWMLENGFLERRRTDARVGDVLAAKGTSLPPIVHAHPDAPAREAIGMLHRFSISQVLVAAPDQLTDRTEVQGTLSDRGLLERIYRDPQGVDRPVTALMDPPLRTVDVRDPLDSVMAELGGEGAAVLVCDGHRPEGVLTRADVLDFLAGAA